MNGSQPPVHNDAVAAALPPRPPWGRGRGIAYLKSMFSGEILGNETNVRRATLWLRCTFISSLIITSALAVAMMIVLADSLFDGGDNTVTILNMSILRASCDQGIQSCYNILLNPFNQTVLINSAIFANNSIQALTILVDGLRTGHSLPDATIVFDFTITTPAIEALWEEVAPLTAEAAYELRLIQYYILTLQQTTLSPAVFAAAHAYLDDMRAILPLFNSIQLEMTDASLDHNRVARTELFVIMGVTLGVIFLTGICAFFPMDRRVTHLLRALVARGDELKRISDDLSIIMRLSPNVLMRLDDNMRVTFANDRAEKLLGVTPGSGDTWLLLAEPDTRAALRGELARLFRREISDVYFSEMPLSVQGDRTRYFVGRALPEIDTAGDCVRSVVLGMTDVSALHDVNNARLTALEAASDANEKRAEESERHRLEQERFVDMICHEIRNPLNGVVNNVDQLTEGRRRLRRRARKLPDSPQKADIVNQLRDEGSMWLAIELCTEHQRRITDDVLQISHLSAGKFSVQQRSFALPEFVAALCNTFRAEARALKIDFIAEAVPNVRLRHDSHRIAQVLVNLISNAFKFTARRDVRRVTLSVTVTPTTREEATAAAAGHGFVHAHIAQGSPLAERRAPAQPLSTAITTQTLAGKGVATGRGAPHSWTGSPAPRSLAGSPLPRSWTGSPLPRSWTGSPLPRSWTGSPVRLNAASPASRSRAASPARSLAASPARLSADPSVRVADMARPPPAPAPPGPLVLVAFSVADTGIGVDDDTRRAFNRPFIGSASKTYGSYGGSGIGLAICRALTEALGGFIVIESELGVGSCFTFSVPCVLLRDKDSEVVDSEMFGTMRRPAALHTDSPSMPNEDDVYDDAYDGDDVLFSFASRSSSQLVDTEGSSSESSGSGAAPSDTDTGTTGSTFGTTGSGSGMAGSGSGSAFGMSETEDKEGARVGGKRSSVDSSASADSSGPISDDDSSEQPISAAPFGVPAALGIIATSRGPPDLPASSSAHIPTTPASSSVGSPASSHKYRVLVAEDNDINRLVLKKQFESAPGHPFTVLVAVNGQEAVDQFVTAADSGTPIDVIIMDVEMPVMNGLVATERIRSIEAERHVTRRVVVVGLSGNARSAQIDQARAAGMDDYLAKPCRQPALLACIYAQIKKRDEERS